MSKGANQGNPKNDEHQSWPSASHLSAADLKHTLFCTLGFVCAVAAMPTLGDLPRCI